ncbi:GGDEF domain-containing protein [Marinobacter mobilis]|uniref:diguanylate cyclase n=1 Tax=Marinobacter mobilis TaxID=488533 RepID=A0A1H2Q3T3_9GAMM|nr:GGDEF domain-containing protein [Marinobacter mobilis]SDW01817.1 diguanylate cyclase (GGDEF) domain-containing protein [Marinobacter mobilis]
MTQARPPAQYSAEDEDFRRSLQLTRWLAVIALMLLLGIGTKSWLSGHGGHAVMLWTFAALIAINGTVYLFLKKHELHMVGLLAIVIVLFGYLFASGGESNTGPLWFYAFPPLLFYLTNLRQGTIMLATCLAMALVIFQWPQLPFVTTEYSADFKIRFLTSVLFESLFCFILEYSRLKARSRLLELARSHEQAARTDELTGLPNRRAMHQRLLEEYSRYQRSGHHFSVALIDLDWFKRINDDYGHDAGDASLKQFADLVRDIVRQTDLGARWGGEEFLLLLPDTSLLQALTLAERLRQKVADTEFRFRDQVLPVTISAGVSSITQSDSVNHLLKQVDVQLYSAKENGRNQIAPRVKSRATTSHQDSPRPS